jgi:hypothetical protein
MICCHYVCTIIVIVVHTSYQQLKACPIRLPELGNILVRGITHPGLTETDLRLNSFTQEKTDAQSGRQRRQRCIKDHHWYAAGDTKSLQQSSHGLTV